MEQVADRVKEWLYKFRHICVPADWLQACIEWIIEENGQSISKNQTRTNNLVLEQWMLSNLSEIGASCLPQDVVTAPKYILKGYYTVQINSILNVTSSFYSQLQKVQGTENENESVSATQYKKPDVDNKSNRMLMMELTDGTVNVKGMEYSQISALNVNLKLGTKLLVHGEVLCRLGVMFLTDSNVQVIGGEVDSFTSSQENLLKQALSNSQHFKSAPQTQSFQGSGRTVKGKGDVHIKEEKQEFNQPHDYNSGYSKVLLGESWNNNVKKEEIRDDVKWEDDIDDEMLMEEAFMPDDFEEPFQNELHCQNRKHSSNQPMSHLDTGRVQNCHIQQEDWPQEDDFSFDNVLDMMNESTEFTRVKEPETPNFKYLIELKQLPELRLIRVKAYIVTLLTKLDFNNGCFWSMSVKLNDGTDTLDVDICDQVLCSLIGYSAQQCLRIKTKGSKQDKIKLGLGLKNCQQNLIQMSSVFELEFGGSLKPVVRDIVQLSEEHDKYFE